MDTMLGGGPHTEAVELLGDELLDEEPPPEQATMKVLNKKRTPNNLARASKVIQLCVMSGVMDHVKIDKATCPNSLVPSCLQSSHVASPLLDGG
jgi:hypothetical protein